MFRIKSLLEIVLCFFVIYVPNSVSASAQSYGEGVLGWQAVNGYYPDVGSACIATYNYFIGQTPPSRNPYMGPVMNNAVSYTCKWGVFEDGCQGSAFGCAVPYPTFVQFYCQSGYTYIGNNRCAPTSELPPPQPKCKSAAGAPNPVIGDPVDILDGSNLQSVTDYSTTDGRLEVIRKYRTFNTFGVNAVNGTIAASAGDWRFNFEVEVHFTSDGNSATVHLPEGVSFDFTRSGNTFGPTSGSDPQTQYQLAIVGTPPSNWSQLVNSSSQWQVTDTVTNHVWLLQTVNDYKNSSYSTPVYNVAKPVSLTQAGGYVWTYSYDQYGTLTSIEDSYGRTFGFTWNYFPWPAEDSNLNNYTKYIPVTISQIVLPSGETLKYTYGGSVDGNGNPTALAPFQMLREELDNSSGNVVDFTTYQYGNTTYPDLLTGVTDARGVQVANYTYDARGRVLTEVGANSQNQYSLAYSVSSSSLPNQLVRTVTNPLGKVAQYNWTQPQNTKLSQLTSIVGEASASCAAGTKAYTYDANGFVASVTDEENRVTSYVNDSLARPTSITRGAGTASAVTSTITWDPTYDRPTQIVAPGLTKAYNFSSTGNLLSLTSTDTTTQSVPYSTNGQVRTWTYTYSSTGQLLTATDPANKTVTYTYDSSGNLHTVTNELSQVTTINSVNTRGEPTSVTDPNGIITALAYDGLGRLTSVSVDTANTPATTTIAYDAVGDVTTITDPIGAAQTFTYDGARHLTNITNSTGESVAYVRDVMGNATSITVKNASNTTAYSKSQTFDELGRIIKSIGAVPANSSYQFAYDRTDNLTSVTDPRSYVFSYGFDPLNHLISETDEQNATVNLTRNGIDAITAYEDARSLTTTYVRNGFGEIIQEVSPDKGTTTYVRDARGLVTQRTDPRGIVTNLTYDNAGRLTGKTYPSHSTYQQSFQWDSTGSGNYGIGKLSGFSSEAGSDYRTFDSKGNLNTDFRQNTPAPTVTVGYNYDAAGNITGTTYPSGHWVQYLRDSIGRISGITLWTSSSTNQAIVSSVAWMPFGGISSFSYGSGLQSVFTYDTDYRITRVQVGPSGSIGATLDRSLSWTGETLDQITDNQNPGQSPSFSWSHQTQTFTYTQTHRLASALGYYGSFAWTYDANGNRLTEQSGSTVSTYAYPSGSNKLSSVTPGTGTPRALTYDAAGNILTDSRSGGLGMTFQYDVEGRLSQATQTNATTNGGTYLYDASNKLASRTVTQSSAPTTTTTLYVYDQNDHLIAETNTSGQTQREYIWLNDIPVAVVDQVNTSPVVYYVHTDHLGRPARMTAANWSWVWDVIYSPFGAVSYIYTNPEVMNAQFPGQWFQLETGLAYNWNRHYDPTLGRYIQPDPLKNDDGNMSVNGISTGMIGTKLSVGNGEAIADTFGRVAPDAFLTRLASVSTRAMLQDGPSVYGYARQSPLVKSDKNGLASAAQGPFSPIPPSNVLKCMSADSDHCTMLYEMCVQRYWSFSPGWNCSSCNLNCNVQGSWPFHFCGP